MVSPAVLDKIESRRKSREDLRNQGFRELVDSLDSGSQVDAEQIEGVLEATGRPVADLRNALRRRERIRQLEELTAYPLEAEHDAIVKYQSEVEKTFEQAKRQHDNSLERIRERTTAFDNRRREIEAAKVELQQLQAEG